MAIAKSEISLRGLRSVSNGALSADALPSRLKIFDWGTSDSNHGDKITLDELSAKVFDGAQKTLGREVVALDFEHNTVPGSAIYKETQEPRSVAAYGTPKIVPGEGLFLENVKWTPEGQKSAKNYMDLSPAPFVVDGRIIGLHSAGLTRAGAVSDLHFYSVGGIETDLEHLATLCLPKPEIPASFPPLASRENVISALAFINQSRNFKAYSAAELLVIWDELDASIKKHGVPTTLNAVTQFPIYDPTKPFVQPTNPMTEKIVALRAALKLPDTTPDADVLMAATALAAKPAPTAPVVPDLTTLTASFNDALKAALTPLTAKVEALNTELENKAKLAEETERKRLVALASEQGKVIPFTEATLKTMSVAAISEMVEKLPKGQVSTRARVVTMNAGKPVPTALERALKREPQTLSANGEVSLQAQVVTDLNATIEQMFPGKYRTN